MGRMINTPRFPLGQVVATPGALAALEKAGQQAQEFLSRHAHGDWGDELSEQDRKENQLSLEHGFRLLSCYRTNAGDKLWILTEADRSSTAVILPEEY
jgi:hypothetical protein